MGRILIALILVISIFTVPTISNAKSYELKRNLVTKQTYQTIPQKINNTQIVIKFIEGTNQPKLGNKGFLGSSTEWSNLNSILSFKGKSLSVKQHFEL